MNPPTHHLQ